MVSLTLQQKNILQHLLNTDSPVAMAELAARLNLTPRQVNYRLKPVKVWLADRDAALQSTPGVGIAVQCAPGHRQGLLNELVAHADFELVLTAGQRQQLVTLSLLTAAEPIILNELQLITAISRSTLFKDLDSIEAWTQHFELQLIRKPNYGILLDGAELPRRQALAALLWGDVPFEKPLMAMAHGAGLTYALAGNRSPKIVAQTHKFVTELNTPTAFEWVAFAEDQLGGRYTDDAVLHLALSLAVQAQRANAGHYVSVDSTTISWLRKKSIWPVAESVSQTMWPHLSPHGPEAEIAAIAMLLLAGLRNYQWPGGLDIEPTLTEMITELMGEVEMAFNTPGLRQDTSLRDGLVAHIIPAFMRQLFGLWTPPSWSDGTLSQEYPRMYAVARELANLVTERTGVVLPAAEIDTLTLLLKAAFIRESPTHPRRVYIICPSGMATAQLLVARLKARFPSLEILGVLSIRELSAERVADAQLLISTAPVQSPRRGLQVIQVHPLLMAEDIEEVTNWLTTTTGDRN